ncbi:MAG: response regulator [Myxococcota bacterium]
MSSDLRHILLVDDSPRDTELALDALAIHNLANAVVVVRDGVEALEYLNRTGAFANRTAGNPVVVLLDLKMPRMDGLETLRAIRNTPSLRMLPVVVLTSSREESEVIESYKLGTNAYIVKPVVFEKFVEAMKVLGTFWAVLNEQPPPHTPLRQGRTA